MRDINKAIEEHKQAVLNYGIKEKQLLGIFLYGSQNYGIETENSDVDTKAIIIPTFEELLFSSMKIKELHLPNGEHCEILDIRHFISNLLKQNINFVETLFTKYYWINPFYQNLWNEFFIEPREKIARYDENKTIIAACAQAKHALKQSNESKKYANALRIYQFITLYEKHLIPYKDCIYIYDEDNYFMKTKILSYKLNLNKPKSEEIKFLINEFEKIQNKYTDKFSLKENKEELQKKKVIENNLQKGAIRMVRALDNYDYINS